MYWDSDGKLCRVISVIISVTNSGEEGILAEFQISAAVFLQREEQCGYIRVSSEKKRVVNIVENRQDVMKKQLSCFR